MRAGAIETHVKISQEPLHAEIYSKNAAPQNEPRTRTHILRIFAQDCAVETHVKISQEPLYTEIYRKNAAPQHHGADFVRACAVKTHVKISQEPLYNEIDRKNAAAQIEPGLQTHTLCEPAQAKRMSRFHRSHFIQKKVGKMPRPRLSPERRHTFCASLRNRNACPHVTKDIRRATLHGNLQEKCRGPDWAQEPRRALCASLRSRNARQDFTRAILHGNLQEKCRNPE